VGPERRARPELAWQAVEPNTFGTDEFLAWAAAAGCEPYICLNMGNGTMDEAIAWAEYCNGAAGTHYADLRRRHGHAEPYGVVYWGLGNEIWGDFQIGHKRAADYAFMARDWAKVLKRLDPGLKLIACGGTANMASTRWDLEVLNQTAELVDYTALHYYWGPRGEDPYYGCLAGAADCERYVRYQEGLIEALRRDKGLRHPIYIALDEWNVAYHSGEHPQPYDLRDALADALFLHMMVRHCGTVKMANLAQTVNVIAPIRTSPENLFLQTIYWPLWFAGNLYGPTLVDCCADVETWGVEWMPDAAMPYLDAVATLDADGRRLALSVVNCHRDADIEAEVAVVGPQVAAQATAWTLTADDVGARNSFDAPERVKPAKAEVSARNAMAYTFPAHSQTVLELRLA
jgi:alpha-N-arabinofuranosidase